MERKRRDGAVKAGEDVTFCAEKPTSTKCWYWEIAQTYLVTLYRLAVWKGDFSLPDIGHGWCFVLEMREHMG